MERARNSRARRGQTGRERPCSPRAGYITFTPGPCSPARRDQVLSLEERLGLPPHHEASPWVRRRGCDLAEEHPYQEALGSRGEAHRADGDHRFKRQGMSWSVRGARNLLSI